MSKYIEGVLGNYEKLLYSAKVSFWSLLPLFFLGVIFIPFYGLGFFFITAYIRYATTELGITNSKIIAKFGFIKRDTVELLLHKVESIRVKQSILGRIFNYGSIIISGAGNLQAPVPIIEYPLKFRNSFMEIQENSKN